MKDIVMLYIIILLKIIILSVIMLIVDMPSVNLLIVAMPSVIWLNVVAPFQTSHLEQLDFGWMNSTKQGQML